MSSWWGSGSLDHHSDHLTNSPSSILGLPLGSSSWFGFPQWQRTGWVRLTQMPATLGVYTSHCKSIIWHSALSPPVSSEWVSFQSSSHSGALMGSSFWTFKTRPWTAATSVTCCCLWRFSAVGQLVLSRHHPALLSDLLSISPQTQQFHLEEFILRR